MNKALCIATLVSSISVLGACQKTPTDTAANSTETVIEKAAMPTFETTGSIEILTEAGAARVDANAKIEILSKGYGWTEGPVWIEDGGYVLYSDIPNNIIHKFDPSTGETTDYLKPSGGTKIYDHDDLGGSNGLLLDSQGRLVLLQQGDRRVAVMTAPLAKPAPEFETLSGSFKGKRLNSPNDAVYHSNGDLFFTDPSYGLAKGMEDPRKQLPYHGVFRVDSNGETHLLDETLTYPNGVALSPDEKTLYVAVSDPKNAQWFAYDLNDGKVSNRRVLFDSNSFVGEGETGLPDGMVVAKDGTIYATGPHGVLVLSPEGELLAKIRTERKTANCTLSADEKTLYMTAHDTFMRVALK